MTSMTDGYMYTPSPISSTATNSHVQQTTKSFLSSTYFMSEDLRNSLLLKNEIANSIDSSSNLPLEVDNYHSLSLLEASSNLPVPSSTYKAIHSSTGIKYCLRRLHSKDGYLNNSIKINCLIIILFSLTHRLQDSVCEINDASCRYMEKILASELRGAP